MYAAPLLPPIVITCEDYDRVLPLAEALAARRLATSRFLKRELDRAEICGPGELSGVAMGMYARFRLDAGARSRVARLCYPREALAGQGISVVSPVGAALIGMMAGEAIDWLENGRVRQLVVEDFRWIRGLLG